MHQFNNQFQKFKKNLIMGVEFLPRVYYFLFTNMFFDIFKYEIRYTVLICYKAKVGWIIKILCNNL